MCGRFTPFILQDVVPAQDLKPTSTRPLSLFLSISISLSFSLSHTQTPTSACQDDGICHAQYGDVSLQLANDTISHLKGTFERRQRDKDTLLYIYNTQRYS